VAPLDAKPGNFAQHLTVPLCELEWRNLHGALDRWIFGEHVLEEADPGLTNAGLAVGQPQEIGSRDIGEGTKYGFGIR
jgi:hypothetical protein